MKFLLPAILLLPLLVGALPAPGVEVDQVNDEKIPNAWIVVLKATAGTQGLGSHLSWLNSVTKQVTTLGGHTQTYDFSTFQGYAGEFDSGTVALIKARPEVEIVEQDAIVLPVACKNQTFTDKGLWGLGRISHREVGPWFEYLYNDNYPFCTKERKIAAYVIDTGINAKHTEFAGRASLLWKSDPSWDNEDKCGHGTHVAGTIGGVTYGVAKNADIYAIKVLDGPKGGHCTGTWSGVIAGIAKAYLHSFLTGNISKSVINMSLAGPRSEIVNLVVDIVVDGGLTIVVAAGNEGSDACKLSPASAPKAITVGASNITDAIASFSNVGCCVKTFAPGVKVLSAFIGSNTASEVFSGTSMASPHVAGLVLYFKCRYGHSTPAADFSALKEHATIGKLTGKLDAGDPACSAPNSLVYNHACGA